MLGLALSKKEASIGEGIQSQSTRTAPRPLEPSPEITRRAFGLGIGAGIAAVTSGCATTQQHRSTRIEVQCKPVQPNAEVDYIIVGSGAGGGPLACGLARRGFTVALLEAGNDPVSWSRDVPALHNHAAEDPDMRWDFFVRHYGDDAQQARDPKFHPKQGGVWYPRAGTLGGCTAHNAMVGVYPHNEDWNHIADLTGNQTWRAGPMRRYFQRMEACDYVDRPSGNHLDPKDNPSLHGFDGWLRTRTADPLLAATDPSIQNIFGSAVSEGRKINPSLNSDALKMIFNTSYALWDPNDWRSVNKSAEGVAFIPLHIDNGARTGPREYIRATVKACPSNLQVHMGALATKVLWDDKDETKAVGVEYRRGAHLYQASPLWTPGQTPSHQTVQLKARREVILAGGVFNSPQLLMLSGVGDPAELGRHGIGVRVPLRGVGRNLQDRYEIGVVSELRKKLAFLRGTTVEPPHPLRPDAAMRQWWFDRKGIYTSNGTLCALIKRSRKELVSPDLFCFGIVGDFKGYTPGYARKITAGHNHFTWAILKGHTHNQSGRVRLRSADPTERPHIDFDYFRNDPDNRDLDAMIEGIHTARRIMARLPDVVKREVSPGPQVQTRAHLARYIKDHTWGHHASCSNKMGPATDSMAVVDSNFKVHGTKGLRIVDASVFPKIPGFFIVTSVYMIAEKAVDVIAADAV